MPLRQVKNRDRSTLRHFGPCFQCRELTPYGDGRGYKLCSLHVQFGDAWLDRAFANGFTSLTRTAENARRRHDVTPVQYPSSQIKPYLCARCRTELEAIEEAEAEQVRLRKAAEDAHAAFERTWRRPERDEFPVQHGQTGFLVVTAGYGYDEVPIRYRTSKRWCVGSKPVLVYAMFVDHHLVGRTYHVCGSDVDPTAVCFGQWFQQHWQTALCQSEHADVLWDVKNPRWRAVSWTGCARGEDLNGVLIHTRWTDGSVYAALEDMLSFADVEDFAKTVLDVQVIALRKKSAREA